MLMHQLYTKVKDDQNRASALLSHQILVDRGKLYVTIMGISIVAHECVYISFIAIAWGWWLWSRMKVQHT